MWKGVCLCVLSRLWCGAGVAVKILWMCVNHPREGVTNGVVDEIIAWLGTEETSRGDGGWHIGEVRECHRSKRPVIPRLGAHDNPAHHAMTTFDLHQLSANLRKSWKSHRRYIFDEREQRAVGQFLRELLCREE